MSKNDTFIGDELIKMKTSIDGWKKKTIKRFEEIDFFCLDNSIRESTVGQLRGHTLQNKIEIYKHIKKAGMTDIIVASFNNMTRVEEQFVPWLKQQGEDFSTLFSFAEVTNGIINGAYDSESLPISLFKNKKYGLYNVFFEADFHDDECDWEDNPVDEDNPDGGGKYTIEEYCQLLKKRIDYVYEYVRDIPDAKTPRILLNIRDFPIAMNKVPERVLKIVKFLAELPKGRNMFALAFEDPLGEYMPEQLAVWTESVRNTMDEYGWNEARLLVHIHQKWDLQTASVLSVLAAGGDGVWASLCEEGAALGHACSVTTMINLVRLGNKALKEKYNSEYFRDAAIEVTKLTTGKDPHPKVPIYGSRSLDLVFSGINIEYDIAVKFFGMENDTIRISTMSSVDMIIERLTFLFGDERQFNKKIAEQMKFQILEDLNAGIKEEYHSAAGLAMLFDRAGGKLTDKMATVLEEEKLCAVHHDNLIALVKKQWDEFDLGERRRHRNDGQLKFDSFYHGFMAPYFSCYRCPSTKKGLRALDMNKDGNVDWKEFLVYIKWALRQYPDIEDVEALMNKVFLKGLIPAMSDKLRSKNLQKKIKASKQPAGK